MDGTFVFIKENNEQYHYKMRFDFPYAYYLDGSILPRQGWKIHLTPLLIDYKNTLDLVYKLSQLLSFSFKCVYNELAYVF